MKVMEKDLLQKIIQEIPNYWINVFLISRNRKPVVIENLEEIDEGTRCSFLMNVLISIIIYSNRIM